jgi:1-phosphofructokinase family hexose kinase
MENQKHAIFTVGVSPAWDITCRASRLDWGDHKRLDSQTAVPAGKALNICRALAWMGIHSTAAGLWGQDDYDTMRHALTGLNIDIRLTPVPGRTRQNITVIDTATHRQMHLRAPSTLATRQSLAQLAADLQSLASDSCMVIFSGALPEGELLTDILSIICKTAEQGAKIILDTSGTALKSVLDATGVYLIKPNLDELRQLLGKSVPDNPSDIVTAARPLCSRAEIIVVSRGEKGALLLTQDAAFHCSHKETRHQAINTVGCGDYLLAGIISRLADGNLKSALADGVRAAVARAWGLSDAADWNRLKNEIALDLNIVQI